MVPVDYPPQQKKAESVVALANALAERTAAYEAAEALAEALQEQRTQLAYSVDKKNWKMEGTEPFTRKELRTLSRLYRDTDYTNNNMFLTSSDDQVTAIDEQLKLYDAAVQDLEISSQPQYVYATDLDNFLSMYKYRQYTDNLELGDFLYLGTQDDYVVKLRLISCSFNPLSMDNDLRIEFSNMVKTGSKRYDTTYLLGLGGNTSKNRISGSAGSASANEGVTLTTGLIQKILSSTLFNNKVANAINQHFQALTGQMIVARNLQAEMIRTSDIHAEDGFLVILLADSRQRFTGGRFVCRGVSCSGRNSGVHIIVRVGAGSKRQDHQEGEQNADKLFHVKHSSFPNYL